MFKNLPESLGEADVAGMIPWGHTLRHDFHVAVYEGDNKFGKNLIYAPKYATSSVFKDCFMDALAEGQRMEDAGECTWYTIECVHNTKWETVSWPHLVLRWGLSSASKF